MILFSLNTLYEEAIHNVFFNTTCAVLIDSSLGCLIFVVQSFYFTLENLWNNVCLFIASECSTKREGVDFELIHIYIFIGRAEKTQNDKSK